VIIWLIVKFVPAEAVLNPRIDPARRPLLFATVRFLMIVAILVCEKPFAPPTAKMAAALLETVIFWGVHWVGSPL
jgi:hypothetical protein